MRRSWKRRMERWLLAMVPVDGDHAAAAYGPGPRRGAARPGRLEATGSSGAGPRSFAHASDRISPWVERELELPPPAA